MASENSGGGIHMYVTEKTNVIAYLAISFGFVQGCTKLRTILTSINYAYIIKKVSSEEG